MNTEQPRGTTMRKNQTRAGLGIFVVSALSVSAVACDFVAGGKELNPKFCQANPTDPECVKHCMTNSGAGCPDAGGVDAPTSCATNAECSSAGTATVCDVAGTKACVLCTATDHAACTGVTPVCSDDKASCRACVTDAQCDSGVCRDDGSCAAVANIIYASPDGSSTTCIQTAPCNLTTAMGKVSTTLNVLHLAPGMYAYTTPLTLDFNKDVTVVGRGATLDRQAVGNNATATVSGDATVTFELVTLTGGDGSLTGNGVSCTSTGHVILKRANVAGNARIGVDAGVCDVSIENATITSNLGGGISITGGSFKLVNNFIVENGNAAAGGSLFGGVTVSSTVTDNVFEQNTIAFNHSLLGNPGATCSAVASFHGKRNIVTRNNLGGDFPAAQSVGCADMESFTAAGTDANELKFTAISPAPLNFHLTAASPATVRDVPGLTTCPGSDIDGDARPFNTLCDLGADEFKP